VFRDQRQIKVRLDGIDAPESGQAFGNRAKQAASVLAFERIVTVQPTREDRYHRLLAEVLLPDGRSLNEELVRQGWAWWFRRYAPNDSVLAALEGEAREARRGLWADPKPIAPWDWRAGRAATEGTLLRGTPDAGGLPAPSNAGPIIANTRSRLYHTPGCSTYEATSLANRVLFASALEAEAAGYRRAASCP
jgi:hypothetical protein